MREKKPQNTSEAWWKTGVVYQIYPRSFQDSGRDGIGDIPGIISRLDYLAGREDSLGIDAIWISPFYPSPMRDFGYDVSNYCDVDPMFGTLEDFKRLLSECHARGIRVIIDLVLNHTSDEHPWFTESKTDRSNPKADWYIWHPGKHRKFSKKPKRPNNWFAAFEMKNAWWWNEDRQEYYLGTFTRHQPEVNWRSPELREAMFGVMRYWFDLGVDGFRLDVINWFIKDEEMRSNPFSFRAVPDIFQKHIYDRNRPEIHGICREMRKLTDSYKDRMLVGEVYTSDLRLPAEYYGRENDELNLAFNFNFLFQKWGAANFRTAAQRWYDALPDGAWPNFTLSNHDNRRHASRYAKGNKTPARERIAAAMLLTLRGTPFIYYGEEIGMQNVPIPRSRLQDPMGVHTWPVPGFGRDGERTPMQWDSSAQAGFTSGEPWLPVSADSGTVNVERQMEDPDSLLSFYRRLLRLRKQHSAITLGDIVFLDEENRDCLSYLRSHEGSSVLVLLNFTDHPAAADLKTEPGSPFHVLLGTHREAEAEVQGSRVELASYEVLIAKAP